MCPTAALGFFRGLSVRSSRNPLDNQQTGDFFVTKCGSPNVGSIKTLQVSQREKQEKMYPGTNKLKTEKKNGTEGNKTRDVDYKN